MRHDYDTTRTGIANQECILEGKEEEKERADVEEEEGEVV